MFNRVKLDITQTPIVEKVDYEELLRDLNFPWEQCINNDTMLRGANLICANITNWIRTF